VYRHAHRLVQNRPDAEDVSAAAFLELWRLRTRVRLVECSVLPWLLVTTTNCALSFRRSTRRYENLLKSLPRNLVAADPAETYLQENALHGVDGHLVTALRALKLVDLQLITLVALEGYDAASAAAILGLSPEAAKTRLHRARQRLRDRLPEHAHPRTRISTELTCLSAGTLYWEDGASMGCGADDIDARGGNTTPLKPGQHSTAIRTSGPEVRYRLKATYVNQSVTEWAVNENGQTFGVANENGSPDLIAVSATNGKPGYAYPADMEVHPDFTSPAEALAWQEAHQGETISVPVYESDGKTVIGEFTIGGGSPGNP
jgi:RNA polymerase sigma-70 factor (ECF subfamily)